MTGIVYALASMLFAGVNDYLFKKTSDRAHGSTGWFMAGVGLVCAGIFAVAMWATGARLTGTHLTTSLAAGMASFLANVLFIKGFRHFPAGVGATIYRLNLVIVALLGFVWLGELVTAAKLVGIAFGVVAVLSLCNGSNGEYGTSATRLGLVMLIVACILRAFMGIFYRIAGLQGIPPMELPLINAAMWVVGGMLLGVLAREPIPADPVFRRTTFASGVLVCGIVYFMYAATMISEASIVIPISQLGFLLTCTLGIAFNGEAMTLRKGIAMLAAIGCVVSLSLH